MISLLTFARRSFIIGAFALVVLLGVVIWFDRADPIRDDGLTTYSDPGGRYKIYTVMVKNESRQDIKLQSVQVNDGEKPMIAKLGITYGSGHQVQYLGEQTDPATRFVELEASPIQPQASEEEILAIIANGKSTPTHYGIMFRYDDEPVQQITIRYTYYGLPKVKHIRSWFEFGVPF
ncbi:hypothetical protein [Paenibacillus xanthanilyticus]|uniref:DUF1616 domain-containing protein n=1 Tax=Paenibacillus xanthanilyticus TaxID=1783531 RepID=A0ABV8K051_9BACL